MTVQVTSLGTNSAYLVYTSGETGASVLTEINTYVTAHGWALYDDISTTKKVYRAIIEGGTNYKYVSLDTGLVAGKLIMKVYESWNNTTHVGTNETFKRGLTTDYNLDQSFNFSTGGYLYMFVLDRYMIFLSRQNGIDGGGTLPGNGWSGCVEFERTLGETANTYPNFGYLSGYGMLGGNIAGYNGGSLAVSFSNGTLPSTTNMGSVAVNTVYYRVMGIPRLSDGTVGIGAENAVNISMITGGIGLNGVLNNSLFAINVPHSNISQANPFSSSPFIMTPMISEMDLSTNGLGTGTLNKIKTVRGRLFGIKFGKNPGTWNTLDTLSIKIDARNFQDTGGTATTHYYLGMDTFIPA